MSTSLIAPHLGSGDVGVVVAAADGTVRSANARARRLLGAGAGAGASATVAERLREVWREIDRVRLDEVDAGEVSIALSSAPALRVRICPLEHAADAGVVLLIEEADPVDHLERVMRQASRHRGLVTLRRDWAHECKGILNVIQVNNALLTRAMQNGGADAALVERCLGAIPREVARLDRSIDLMLPAEDDDRQSTFDVGETTGRLVQFVEVRARRQHVTTSFELGGGSRDVTGFEDRLGGAVLGLLVNALDAMPDGGRLEVAVQGGASVRIRVCDSGPGLEAGPSEAGRPADSVHREAGGGIGLLVARSVVEAHQGRLTWRSSAPRGTCVECVLPAVEPATER
jgi:two-component system sensor histidine kinase HydH